MMETCQEVYGELPYQIQGTAVVCGRDIHLSFTGGTHGHTGAVSLAVYEPERDSATVSTVSVYGHRDDRLSGKAAKDGAVMFQCTATATVGIHMEDAGPEDIQLLSENFARCCQRLLEKARMLFWEKDPYIT